MTTIIRGQFRFIQPRRPRGVYVDVQDVIANLVEIRDQGASLGYDPYLLDQFLGAFRQSLKAGSE